MESMLRLCPRGQDCVLLKPPAPSASPLQSRPV